MDEKLLLELYVNRKLSTREIAAIMGVNQTTVARQLRKAGIPARPKTENKMPTPKGGRHSWGPAISAANKGNPRVGRANAGKRGPDAPNWKGGEVLDDSGHIRVWDPDRRRYVPRAHLVWLAANPGEVVGRGNVIHHIDENKLNDVPENLAKLTIAAHIRLHRARQSSSSEGS